MELFLRQLLLEFNIEPGKLPETIMAYMLQSVKVNELSKSIADDKRKVMSIFHLYRKSEEFKNTQIVLPNAFVNRQYEYQFVLSCFPEICINDISNLNDVGLYFDPAAAKISGTPTVSLSLDLQLSFICRQGDDQVEDIKVVPFFINADPKSLWQNKPSNKDALFPKEDSDKYAGPFLDKHIVVASQRGRSHAHEGSFRDDHFFTRKLPLGWEVIAVADGAGSARFSRHGSSIATTFISDSFDDEVILSELSDLCRDYFSAEPAEIDEPADERALRNKSGIINILYKSVRNLHTTLSNIARQEQIQLKDLNTTLIFALVRKFDPGYVVLTFGVGDCPINIIARDPDEVKLLNQLDIGEFGGGTRFVTMPEIFTNDIAKRFSIHMFKDFYRLVLMTDGVYDPKFVTESKLEDNSTWDAFLADLDGANEDKATVDFLHHEGIEDRLLSWLDFWSKGNHDDRTIALIY